MEPHMQRHSLSQLSSAAVQFPFAPTKRATEEELETETEEEEEEEEEGEEEWSNDSGEEVEEVEEPEFKKKRMNLLVDDQGPRMRGSGSTAAAAEDGGGGGRGGGGVKVVVVVPSLSCRAENCNADLNGCKDYHKRHKVCEYHAKAEAVVVEGLKQRFCQQCSKFHDLLEFDETKRSCRRRLAGHNERRRKHFTESRGEGSSGRGRGSNPGGSKKGGQCREVDERGRSTTTVLSENHHQNPHIH